MAYQITQSVRTILPALAEAVLPVQGWTRQKPPPKYDQFVPGLVSVPWRPVAADPTLSTATFEIVRFLEILADDDGVSEALAPRWNAIKADPTKYFQSPSGQSPAQWRAGRAGLRPDDARFGAFDPDSSNFAFVAPSADGKKLTALSRKEFYDPCWTPLAAAYQFKPPGDPAGWAAFRDNLRTNQFPDSAWPTSSTIKSSAFIRQFTFDVLRACLGQRNHAMTASDPILQRAALIEAGENRYRGNAYTEQQAGQAVATFTNSI
jgi:hypothetical protein